jgi:hypothetical protein
LFIEALEGEAPLEESPDFECEEEKEVKGGGLPELVEVFILTLAGGH